MKNSQPAGRQGFTLIEILVSVGLIAIIGVVVSNVFLTTIRTNIKVELLKDVKQNGDFALDVLTRMIRNATSIASTCTGAGYSANSIIINNPTGSTTTFDCVQDGSAFRIASRSATKTEFLTSKNVSLGGTTCANSTLLFTCTTITNETASVKVVFGLSQVGTPVDQFEKASTSYQTTILSRN